MDSSMAFTPRYARLLTALHGIPGMVVRAPATQGRRHGAVPASKAAMMRSVTAW